MAYQDFTTYTEVDPDGKLSQSSTRSTWAAVTAHTEYLYKDFGVAYFAGNFTHKFDVNFSSVGGVGEIELWGLANDLGDFHDLLVANKSEIVFSLSGGILYIQEIYGGTGYYNTANTPTTATTYYCKVNYDSAVGTYGTFYLNVYPTDADRTDNTNVISSKSLALHATPSFRYLYAAQSASQVSCGAGYVENLSLGVTVYSITVPLGDLTLTGHIPTTTGVVTKYINAVLGLLNLTGYVPTIAKKWAWKNKLKSPTVTFKNQNKHNIT